MTSQIILFKFMVELDVSMPTETWFTDNFKVQESDGSGTFFPNSPKKRCGGVAVSSKKYYKH